MKNKTMKHTKSEEEEKPPEFSIRVGDVELRNFYSAEINLGIIALLFENENIQKYLEIFNIQNKSLPPYCE